MFARMLFSAIIVVSCLGCSQKPQEVSILRRDLTSTQRQLDSLRIRTDSLVRALSISDLLENTHGIAYLTPGNDGYSIIQTDLGALTVELRNVVGYASGSRVIVRFGNVTSARLEDVSAYFEWGKVNEQGYPQTLGAKSRRVILSRALAPGSWNDISVILEGIPATQLGYVRVSQIRSQSMTLTRPQ